MYGPKTELAEYTHARKYRGKGESFEEYAARVADVLSDDKEHFFRFKRILEEQRFLPGGRVQSAIGSPREVTAFNCFVAPTIEDSMEGIMDVAKYAATTMRLGGGIGYDFSTIRPNGSNILSLDSPASGPISFMEIYNAVCKTVSSAGNRRGAQMGVLRVDHPDIEEFVEAKNNNYKLTAFNISVGVTDLFMNAVANDTNFDLVFNDVVYKTIRARKLWDKIMRATWDWAEPGILFLDRINTMNNLWYCETIAATNPCGEQPLPPNGACLLGSFNLTTYIDNLWFDEDTFRKDIADVVRAMDNIIDKTIYPLEEQRIEAKYKRRMGLGLTGVANTLEAMGFKYGSKEFTTELSRIMEIFVNEAYFASALLAKEKGAFPLYEEDYLKGHFVKVLREDVRELISKYGIRNSHLISIAPTGTISLCADNVSSGIEPVYSYNYSRTIIQDDEAVTVNVEDYGSKFLGVKGKTVNDLSVDEHLNVLLTAQYWTDSACSKTINVGDDVTWDEFKDVYMKAWKGGAKGVTTFRAKGKRYGILKETASKKEAEACYYDPVTGNKECA